MTESSNITWQERSRRYFKRCYECNFDLAYAFTKGKAFCQVIGAAIYGENADSEAVDGDDTKFGYSDEKSKHIMKVQNKIYDLSPTENIEVTKTMIYIYISEENQGPTMAFKFKSKDGDVWIDASCRIYSTWDDFKNNNTLPSCQVAYPKHGVFDIDKDDNVLIDFLESPACFASATAATVGDTTAGVLGFASMGVSLVGLFTPITAPLAVGSLVAGAASGIYGAARSGYNIYDRGVHGESIDLTDHEARLHWLNIVTAPLAVAGGAATMVTSKLAASGQVISKTSQVIVNSTIISAFTMSTASLINNSYNLFLKAQKNELTVLDITSFAISAAFWTHSAVNLKTAEGIIKTTQRDVIKNYGKGLDAKGGKQFKRMVGNTIDETVPRDAQNPLRRNMHDNAKVIRSIKEINNPKDFFQQAYDANKEIRKENRAFAKGASINPAKLKLSLDDYSCMNINNQLKISPRAYTELCANDRKTILKATLKYINDKDQTAFLKQVKKIKAVKFEPQRQISFEKFSKFLQTDDLVNYTMNGKKPFKNLLPHEKDRVTQIMNSLSQFDGKHQDIAKEFAQIMNPENMSEYSSYIEYALAHLRTEMKNVDLAERPQNLRIKVFRINQVNKKYFNVDGNFMDNCFVNMKASYASDLVECTVLNKDLKPSFAHHHAATYLCKKHGHLDFDISSQEYMNKIQSVLDNATEKHVSFAQHGNSIITSYVHDGYKALVITNDKNAEYTMTMFKT